MNRPPLPNPADLPLPFRDGTFALVVCTQALHLVRDPAATVRQMRRVLAPGGHAGGTVLNAGLRPLARRWPAC